MLRAVPLAGERVSEPPEGGALSVTLRVEKPQEAPPSAVAPSTKEYVAPAESTVPGVGRMRFGWRRPSTDAAATVTSRAVDAVHVPPLAARAKHAHTASAARAVHAAAAAAPEHAAAEVCTTLHA